MQKESAFHLLTFLFSPKGRINRLSMGILMAIAFAISAPLIILWPYVCTWFILKVIGISVITCPIIKRFHDRGKSGWWYLYVLFALIFTGACTFFSYIRAHHLYFFSMETLDESSIFLLKAICFASAIAYIGVAAWFFTELFLLRGTQGANAYGPDPLKKQ